MDKNNRFLMTIKTMGLFLKIGRLEMLICLYLCAGVRCVQQMSWLPCQFIDENVTVNDEGHVETQRIHREATLQFGHKEVSIVNPNAITFLVTGSKLDLRRYIKVDEVELLECELRRYSTEGIHVRWPVRRGKEYNRWFTCTIKHLKGLFTVTGFLRQPSDQPPSGQHDYRSWTPIEDREVLDTSVVMVIATQTPLVKASLGSKQKLHCQFAVDHKGPNITTEWHWQHRGERVKLFGHNSRKGQTVGSGVGVKSLAGGDASYTLPLTKMNSEGMYVCSVSVMPLFASLDISLNIEEPPRVSLNIGPTLSLLEGEEQKVVCDAESYYPLDVEILWQKQDPATSGQRVGGSPSEVLNNTQMASHRHNLDKTFSLSAFFYLEASPKDSGKEFTCTVHHQALRTPIIKSFNLTVKQPRSWMFTFSVGVLIFILLLILYKMLLFVREPSVQKKPD